MTAACGRCRHIHGAQHGTSVLKATAISNISDFDGIAMLLFLRFEGSVCLSLSAFAPIRMYFFGFFGTVQVFNTCMS